MSNPIKALSRNERIFWIVSLIIVTLSNFFSGDFNILTLAAALIGVTAVLFGAKGNVWGQILISVFAILYGIISWRNRYWGEMITYLGMSLPMALWSIYTWIRNPSSENTAEVKINKLNAKNYILLISSGVAVTIGFYFLLKFFDTPNLIFSTLSIITSFFAAALTMLRSSYFALWYAMNDVILIVLWVMASIANPVYIPVIANFVVFLFHDLYGFYSWKKREKTQNTEEKTQNDV
ncbi:MAG: nicotinamide riboside transporter PnuC [Lachnospiraceae bacterium]|nr:nicotinamide riboside transporter PnuC [Lachnospiraceae bacterium]